MEIYFRRVGAAWIVALFLCFRLAAAEAPETFSYISCGTFEYSGSHNFRIQNAGIIDVMRQPTASGDYSYTIMSKTDLMVGNRQQTAELDSPPFVILRDAANREITGGMDDLKEIGEVGNKALALAGTKVITDGKWRQYELPMNPSSFYPARPGFKVKYVRLDSRALGPCIMVTAVSDFFVCAVPDAPQPLTGLYKMVLISDPTLRNTYYRCSGYEARMGAEQVNAKDNFWLGLPDSGKPVDLSDIRPALDRELETIFMPDRNVLDSDSTIPPWAVHALAVKRYMDVTCGAVVEGQPNFAIMMTIGGILLIDSAVSAGSELLAWGVKKTTGKEIFVYKGIPNYIGQGVGWGGAKVYEKVTGNKADTEKWKTVGGDIADIGSMFISPGAAAKGVKAVGKGTQWGIKMVDGRKYDQVIRIGKNALSSKTAEFIGKLFNWKTGLQKIGDYGPGLFGGGSQPGGSQPGGTQPGGSSGGGTQPGGTQPGGGPSGGSSGGGVPGGITLEGHVDNLAIASVRYLPENNSFILNDRVTYASPLPAGMMAFILKRIETEDHFGISLAGKMTGGVDRNDPLYQDLATCDIYLGNIIFGRPEKLPSGCLPSPTYKPVQPPKDQPGALCALFNFRCKFQMERNMLKRRNVYLEVSLLPYRQTTQGTEQTYEAAEWTNKDRRAAEAYEKNLSAFDTAFYLKQPAVIKIINYCEAAAFARSLKNSGVNLAELAAKMTATPQKPKE